MFPIRLKASLRGAAALALLMGGALRAAAQEVGPYFDVNVREVEAPYIQWTFLALFVVLTLLVAFKNPHRSHLD